MEVSKVGVDTLYGKLALELGEKEPISPLKSRLTDLAKIISKLGYIGAILVTIAYLYSKIVMENNYDLVLIKETLTNFHQMADYLIYALTLSVTIIVVAVPEGLPMMITLVLSSNMKRMLKSNVLVRKLVGIETAGNINVLLTDKTGTLTKGKLEVVQVLNGNLDTLNLQEIKKSSLYYDSLYYNNDSSFTDDLKVVGGNITDQAILKYVGENKVKKNIFKKKQFNSQDKYSSVTLNDNMLITYFKGASEVLLPFCTKYFNGREELPLTNKNAIINKIQEVTKTGVRVLLLAYKKGMASLNNLVFQGLIFLKDDLREEARKGVSLINEAGIQVVMITGDAKETALSIAKEVGIYQDSNDLVLTSLELNKLSDKELISKLPNLKVVARALPMDKSRLVKLFQIKNLIICMIG